MKVDSIIIYIFLALPSIALRVIANDPLVYKIQNNMKSQANVASSIQVESIDDCVLQFGNNTGTKAVQYKNGTCELIHERYSCLNLESGLNNRIHFLGIAVDCSSCDC